MPPMPISRRWIGHRTWASTFSSSRPKTPFARADAAELKRNAAAVIARYFPDAPELYARRGWTLPTSLGRVYDAGRAERRIGFRCRTGFAEVLDALREGRELPFVHDPSYLPPKQLGS